MMDSTVRKLAIYGAVAIALLLLVTPAGSALVAGQVAGPNGTNGTNTTGANASNTTTNVTNATGANATNSTNATNNSSSAVTGTYPGTAGTGAGAVASNGSSASSDAGFAKGIVNWIFSTWAVEQIGAAFTDFLAGIISYLGGTPTCQNSGAYGVFGLPTSDPCKAFFYQFYVPIVLPLSFILVMTCSGLLGTETALGVSLPWSTPTAQDMTSRSMLTLILIGAWWWIASAVEKFVNWLGLMIMPNAEALTASTTGFLQLSGAAVLTVVTGYVAGTGEMIALWLLYGVRDAAVMVFRYTMPLLFVGAIMGPHPKVRAFFSGLAWQWMTVLIIVLPGIIMMRLGFIAGWQFSENTLINLSVALGFFGVGLFGILLLGWLSTTLHSVATRAANGAEPISSRADGAMERGAERVQSKGGDAKTRAARAKQRIDPRHSGESAFQPQEDGWSAESPDTSSAGSGGKSTRASRFGGSSD